MDIKEVIIKRFGEEKKIISSYKIFWRIAQT